MTNNNNFNLSSYDLGEDSSLGLDKASIDNSFSQAGTSTPIQCYDCHSPQPQYRVLAKSPRYDTADIQNGVYICKHCLSRNILDANIYGVRSI